MAAPRGPRVSSADRLASRQSAAIDQLSPQSMNQSASRVEVQEERRRRGCGSWPSLTFSCVLCTRNVHSIIASRIITFLQPSHTQLTVLSVLSHRTIILCYFGSSQRSKIRRSVISSGRHVVISRGSLIKFSRCGPQVLIQNSRKIGSLSAHITQYTF